MAGSPATPWRASRTSLRVTREGWWFLLIVVGVTIAAGNTGNNLLYLVLGFLLSLIVLSGVMSESALRGTRLERRLPVRAFAATTTLVEIVLTNEKRWRASYSLEVEDLAVGLATERRCYFLKVAPGARQVAAYRRTPAKRGLLALRGFRVATRHPFGLFEKWRVVESPATLVVYPALATIGPGRVLAAGLGDDEGDTRAGAGAELLGLREGRSGDPERSVHWRRSASVGRLLVRERARDESPHLALELDNAAPGEATDDGGRAAWDAAFEDAISRAAALARRALEEGASVEVLVRGARSPVVDPGHAPDPIFRFLALLGSQPAATSPPLARPSRVHARVLPVALTVSTQKEAA